MKRRDARSSTSADTDGLTPLAAVNHTGTKCRTGTACNGSSMVKFSTHYNSGGYHKHVVNKYMNHSNPWYYCNIQGPYVKTTVNCGTP